MSKNASKPAVFYNVQLFRSAEKDLEKLPPHIVTNITRRIDALAFDPHPAQSKKLVNDHNRFRLRIGDYRALYRIDHTTKQIFVYQITHRKDAYR